MYESHFEFQTRPFVAAPRIEAYVPAALMEQARQTLIRCVERAEGPGLIVGPAGSGKSLLCQLLADYFRRQQFQVALLASARLSTRRALLQNILFELHLPYRGMEEGELRLSLIDHLEPRGSGLAGLLLLVDEAHTLPLRLLEEIRLICNFIRDGQPRVHLILAGSAELEERLASPKLESLQQRIAGRCYLQSFNCEETSHFIRQQVQRAGGDESLFTLDALKAVYSATDGVPRLVNQVCDHALVLSAVGGHTQIGADAIEEAWSDLQQLPAPWHQNSQRENAAASTVIEFGQLQDDEGVVFATTPDAAPAAESATESRAAVNLDRIDRGLGALDSAEGIEFGTLGDLYEDAQEFEPIGDAGTQVELTFLTPANPFGDGFDEEEIVIDRYATLAANHVSDLIDQQDGTFEIADQIMELARRAATAARPVAEEAATIEEEPKVVKVAAFDPGLPAADIGEPLRVHVGIETFNPASDPVLPEEKSVSRRDKPRQPGEPARPQRSSLIKTQRREYRTLFSTLRNR
jgi:type II secretory pathway predicted ATPase ExeA